MKPPAEKTKPVAATELAKLVVCEQQLVFDKQRGKRVSKAQKEAMAAGQEQHRQHHEQVQYYKQLNNRRCFVATALFGADATETRYLRAFRDELLIRSRPGRWLIQCYYRYSPALAQYLLDRRYMKAVIRAIIRNILLPPLKLILRRIRKPPC